MINKILERLNAEADKSYHAYTIGFNSDDRAEYDAYIHATEIVQEVAQEHTSTNTSTNQLDTSTDGWIPVEDRLPEADDVYGLDFSVDVLVWDGQCYFEAYYSFFDKYWINKMNESKCQNKILAWKFIDYPSPYQPKGE